MGLERLNAEKDFCETFESVASGTNKDRQGDIIPLSELKKVKKQMEENPEKRVLTYKHGDRVVGEILDVRIEEKDDHHLLITKNGVYEDAEDVADEIKQGELRGLSITISQLFNIDEGEAEGREPVAETAIPGIYKQEIVPIIEENDEPVKLITQKDALAPIIIQFIADNPLGSAYVIKDIYQWYMSKDDDEQEEIDMEAQVEEDEIDFDVDEDEFEEQLDELKEKYKERE